LISLVILLKAASLDKPGFPDRDPLPLFDLLDLSGLAARCIGNGQGIATILEGI